MPHRPERLAESIRNELTEMIEGELTDPRIGLAAITEIHLDPKLRVAHIFVSVTGNEDQQQQCLAGLIAARPLLRGEIGVRLQLRKVPELRFEIDRSETAIARLDQLLERAHRRQPRIPAEPPMKED